MARRTAAAKRRNAAAAAAAIFAAAAVALWLATRGGGYGEAALEDTSAAAAETAAAGRTAAEGGPKTVAAKPKPVRAKREAAEAEAISAESGDETDGQESAAETEEERQDRLVDEFDALVDSWMEEGRTPPTLEDTAAFRRAFTGLPEKRKEECIHRALNLIPDSGAILLAGVLLDKTQPEEILQAVYSDILNRPEEVKKPILREVFKDKQHPCWADTAWIFEVTGEAEGGK